MPIYPSDDEEAVPSVRPTISRSDAAHAPSSPLLISSFQVLSSSGTGTTTTNGGSEHGNYLEEVSLKQALRMKKVDPSQQQQQQYWIDVEIQGDVATALPSLHDTVLRHLDVPSSFMRRHLQDATQLRTPQVLPLHDVALIVTRILGSGYAVRHAAALCLRDTVVTITSSSASHAAKQQEEQEQEQKQQSDPTIKRRKPVMAPQHDTLQCMLERELPEATASGSVLLWLNFHVGRTAVAAHRLRETTYALTEQMAGLEDYGGVECVSLAQIVQAKDALLKLSAVAEEQNECVAAVAEGDAVTEGLTFDTTPALKGALGVLRQSASSTERLIFRLEKRVADLQTNYDAHQVSTWFIACEGLFSCRLICSTPMILF